LKIGVYSNKVQECDLREFKEETVA